MKNKKLTKREQIKKIQRSIKRLLNKINREHKNDIIYDDCC